MAIRYDGSLQRQGSLKPIQQGREFDWVLQRHLADRAGLHYDLRLGDPDTGLLSWAVPKARLPENPGESVLAIRQPVHCLPGYTLVHTEEGLLPIGTIVRKRLSVRVLSANEITGRLEYRRITNYWERPAEDLVAFEASGQGQGSHGLVCTAGHAVCVPNGKKQAGDLRVGDLCLIPGTRLSVDQVSILYGTLLGDSCVGEDGRLRMCHCAKQAEYCRWKADSLSTLGMSVCERPTGKGGFGKPGAMWTWASSSSGREDLKEIRRSFYATKRKEIPPDVPEQLDWLGWAVLFQDDGSAYNPGGKHHDTLVSLATHAFSVESVRRLQRGLLCLGNLKSTITARGVDVAGRPKLELRLRGPHARAFLRGVLPFVHPSMAYKVAPLLTVGHIRCLRCQNEIYREKISRGRCLCHRCLHISLVQSGAHGEGAYERAYAADHSLVSPRTYANRFGTFSQAVSVLADESVSGFSDEAFPPIGVVGSALSGLDLEGIPSALPARVRKWARVLPGGRAAHVVKVYNIEVEENHNYVAGSRGVLIGNSYSYGKFEGTIDKGRGKGTVELADTGRLAVTEATPNHIRFALLHPRNPKEYTLMRKGGDTWFLINTTPGHSIAEAYPKQHYRVTKDPESMLQPGVTASPKIDGAAVLMEFMRNRADVSSIRPSSTGGPIKHTWRIGGLDRIRVPKPLQGSVLRGEVYGKRGTKVIPIQELGAYLNMATLKSREAQRREGVRLHVGLYGLARPGTGQTAPKSRQELRKLFDLAMTATGGVAHPLPEADDPESARKLLELVKSGTHPLTREGVVFFKEGQKPTKYVTSQENDVYIREIFPAETTTGRPRAGGFTYSLTKDGPVVGRVGSGFSRADAEDMLQNPEQWLGRTARVSAKDQFESGAYRTPVFLARHEG